MAEDKDDGISATHLHRQFKRKTEDHEGEPDRSPARRRRIQFSSVTIDTGAGICSWLDASDDEGTDDASGDDRGGTQAPDDPEPTCDGRGGTQAPDDAAVDVEGRGGAQAPEDASVGVSVGSTKRTETTRSITEGGSKRRKSVNSDSAMLVSCEVADDADDGSPEPGVNGSSKRLKNNEEGAGRHRKCERFYIGDEGAIHTHYRVRGKSEPGRLFKRKR